MAQQGSTEPLHLSCQTEGAVCAALPRSGDAARARAEQSSGEVVELAVLDAREEGADFRLGELDHAGRAVLRVADSDDAAAQFRHLDAVAVRAAALALPPGAEFVREGQAVEGHAVGVGGVEHGVLFSLSCSDARWHLTVSTADYISFTYLMQHLCYSATLFKNYLIMS